MKIKKLLKRVARVIVPVAIGFAIIGSVITVAPPQSASAGTSPGSTVFQPNIYMAVSNYAGLVITSNSVATTFGPTTNQAITVKPNQGDAWILTVGTTNANTSKVVVGFDVSADGTTWTTLQPLSATNTLVSTATNTYLITFDRSVLNNVRYVFPTSIYTTSTGYGLQILSLVESHGNQ